MSDTNHVGPIVFSNDTAREQLLGHGKVITFRPSDRTTGSTWWRKSRTGEKMGDCHVLCWESDIDPTNESKLVKYQPYSGFESVSDWQRAISGLHGEMPSSGNLYLVTIG